ncbi:carbohydrate kinase family protein [Deinococcus peraridilitoris]|uniref:Sugar kinase, ribokinase n=1 Tax=Deinococcus peraridilitoris (strain DSM 19664 / LMG 22246 / CIP 109416 / KR-200) TaxID=937777 RepID=L0A4V4_DEIPD|nr:carbohydrate kinase family protein [Deinococcus peraridilitoris]AFZ68045.1 sugar kinase, ribokinase [Deinococcus peraridilitoris DSM 19664]
MITARAVTVIGGANVDVKLTLNASPVPATSNPGRLDSSPGGVARNVAENLARLRVPVRLISAVGNDAHGEMLLSEAHAAGVDVTSVLRVNEPTGTYTAVLAPEGELVIAVAAMDVTAQLNVSALQARRSLLEDSALVIVDGNLSSEALSFVGCTAHEAGVPLIIEPVSVPKAAKVRALLHLGLQVHTLTPNCQELEAMLARPLSTHEDLLRAARELHGWGVQRVWVRLGADGSLFCTARHAEVLPALPARVTDVTGAGDAMLAGYAAALLEGQSDLQSARFGHAAAALTVESSHTVSPVLTPEALHARLKGN